MYFLNYSNDWCGCCLFPLSRGSLQLSTGPTSKWLFVPGLPSESPEIAKVGTPTTLGRHNFACRPMIEMRSKTKL
jgi:hypothetical protein